MAAMTDHDDLAALLAHPCDLDVHFRHQRARRIEDAQTARLGVLPHRLGHAVSAEYPRATRRHLGQVFDEYRTLHPQIVDDVLVVDDFVPNIDRRPMDLQRTLDDLDGTVHAGAEAARLRKNDTHIECSRFRRLRFLSSFIQHYSARNWAAGGEIAHCVSG